MNKSSNHKIKTKYLLWILTVLCIVGIATSFFIPGVSLKMRTGFNQVLVPVQKGINHMGLWFSNKKDMFEELDTVKKENKELQSKVNELKQDNSLLAQDKYELERYRSLYKLDQSYASYSKVAAKVIAKAETGNWFNSFTIDKGSKDGITKDMNVIGNGGLIGIVTEVGKNYAKVSSIIDDGYNVSGKNASSSDLCVVEGDLSLMNKGLLKISEVPKNATIKEGDMILTSPVSNKYLPGILIGYVTEIHMDSNDLTQSGYIMPAADFEHLEEVFVITQKKEQYEESTTKSSK